MGNRRPNREYENLRRCRIIQNATRESVAFLWIRACALHGLLRRARKALFLRPFVVRETQMVTIAVYRRSQPPVSARATGRGESAVLMGLEPTMGAGLIAGFLAGASRRSARVLSEHFHEENLALLGGASLAAAVPEPWPLSLGNHKGRSGV